tara:strand:- start:1382 stop:1873 length:492 start_codon:yes stop_codon:yes gene_type:complete
MIVNTICTPALIYLIFAASQVLIDTFKGLYNTALVKLLLTFVFTFILNYLCSAGLGILAWIIIFIPFILMSVIVTLLLFSFNLDPKTGKIRRDDGQKNVSRDIILYHDHGSSEGNYNHGKGVETDYNRGGSIEEKRNYRFKLDSTYVPGVDMRSIRDQRLSNY